MDFEPSPVSITSVRPGRVHTGGRTLVEIRGAGFREPPDADDGPPTGAAPAPTVRVLIGGAKASEVEVLGPDLIYCRAPVHDPGPADVEVQNLGQTRAEMLSGPEPFAIANGDSLETEVNGEAQSLTIGGISTPGAATAIELAANLNQLRRARAVASGGRVRLRTDRRGPGATLRVLGGTAAAATGLPTSAAGSETIEPIEGEGAVLTQAITFARPSLTTKAPPTLALEQLIVELRRQVIENVSFTTNTDYDPETGDMLNTAAVASLPAIVLGALEMPDDPTWRALGRAESPGASDDRVSLKAPLQYVQINMTLVGVTNVAPEALNLYTIVRRFFQKNPWLYVPRAEGRAVDLDDEDSFLKLPLDWRMGLPAGAALESDNLITFTGQVSIRGVPMGDMPLAAEGALPDGAPPGEAHEATSGLTWRAETIDLSTRRQ